MMQQGKRVRSSPSEEEGAEEAAWDELNATTCPPAPLMGKGRENQELNPGEREEEGEY